ncbi:unnamed protein product [Protopolystoma xenopodis]|uniref:Uncharacterized protein n=1 Tax=Protopolystoma xenopodis TaxID=117903 RepID=A0A3S5APG8_9PLAT|nr:unnamed protein product [Protopolystoma xenopodis]
MASLCVSCESTATAALTVVSVCLPHTLLRLPTRLEGLQGIVAFACAKPGSTWASCLS